MGEIEAEVGRGTRRDLRHDNRTVSLLTDHLVFSPKYRGKVLLGEVAEAAEENLSLEKKALPKKHEFSHLKEWCQSHLWAPSCYHGSVGHGWEVVEKYISGQKGHSYYFDGNPEPYGVFVSDDGANWESIGEGKGVAEFDIADTSLDRARYVKVVDTKKDTGGESPGPDIDAVKALRFESGHNIFAESVADYYPGGKNNKHDDPADALIPGDEKYFSLGGGYIVCDMGAGTEIIDNPGSDIRVYELGDFDQYSVYISQDMDEWAFVGEGMGTTEFDISSTGLSRARYVQVSDGIKEDEASGESPGADIDGIKPLRFEVWPDKVLFNGGKKSWGGDLSVSSGKSPAKKTVEFAIPTTLEQYGTKELTVVVQYVCVKECGPGYLQFGLHGEKYYENRHEHVIRTVSIDVKPDGEKSEETPGFEGTLSFAGLLVAAIYLSRRRV